MPRAIVCILDSFGIGGAPDAIAVSAVDRFGNVIIERGSS